MKSISKLAMVLLILIGSMAVQAQDKKAFNIDDSKIGLQGYSPVSYVELGLAQRGSKEFKVTHESINYYFTSKAQAGKFKANPSKYLPEFGGFCAFGVYAGAKFRTDPHKFTVSNGKLYLFLYDVEVDAKQLWIAEDEAKLLSKARANWTNLKKTI